MSSPLTIYTMNGSASGMGTPDYSNLTARISRLEDSAPYIVRGNTLAKQGRSQFLPLDSSGVVNGKLDLTQTGAINFRGAMSPAVADGSFSVACPDSTDATIFWDGTNSSRVFVLRAADSTSQTIPGNSISISGLTASTKYSVFPYWVPFNACGLGFAPGDTGTPQIAFSPSAAATLINQAQSLQNLAGREAMPVVTWTQPGGGGSSGGTPTGSGGLCVRMGTSIEPLGSFGPSEIQENMHPHDSWTHLEVSGGMSLECTPDHMLYHAVRGKVEAQTLKVGDLVITRQGEKEIINTYSLMRPCTKVEVRMTRGHLYWANGFLSHNFKTNLLP